MTIKIIPNDKGNPPGKLADVELDFTEGELEGLKLIGFAVWKRRKGAGRDPAAETTAGDFEDKGETKVLAPPTQN